MWLLFRILVGAVWMAGVTYVLLDGGPYQEWRLFVIAVGGLVSLSGYVALAPRRRPARLPSPAARAAPPLSPPLRRPALTRSPANADTFVLPRIPGADPPTARIMPKPSIQRRAPYRVVARASVRAGLPVVLLPRARPPGNERGPTSRDHWVRLRRSPRRLQFDLGDHPNFDQRMADFVDGMNARPDDPPAPD